MKECGINGVGSSLLWELPQKRALFGIIDQVKTFVTTLGVIDSTYFLSDSYLTYPQRLFSSDLKMGNQEKIKIALSDKSLLWISS